MGISLYFLLVPRTLVILCYLLEMSPQVSLEIGNIMRSWDTIVR